jgi:hypothetical protein
MSYVVFILIILLIYSLAKYIQSSESFNIYRFVSCSMNKAQTKIVIDDNIKKNTIQSLSRISIVSIYEISNKCQIDNITIDFENVYWKEDKNTISVETRFNGEDKNKKRQNYSLIIQWNKNTNELTNIIHKD